MLWVRVPPGLLIITNKFKIMNINNSLIGYKPSQCLPIVRKVSEDPFSPKISNQLILNLIDGKYCFGYLFCEPTDTNSDAVVWKRADGIIIKERNIEQWFDPNPQKDKALTIKKDSKPNEGFLNESGLKFHDISSETEREYIFPNGTILFIGNPLYLNVNKESGGHRLYTEDGWCYYVKPSESWAIRWKVREGTPHFSL